MMLPVPFSPGCVSRRYHPKLFPRGVKVLKVLSSILHRSAQTADCETAPDAVWSLVGEAVARDRSTGTATRRVADRAGAVHTGCRGEDGDHQQAGAKAIT